MSIEADTQYKVDVHLSDVHAASEHPDDLEEAAFDRIRRLARLLLLFISPSMNSKLDIVGMVIPRV